MELNLDDHGVLREVFFEGEGCCISQASASMLAERVEGQTLENIKKFTARDMLDLFGARDAGSGYFPRRDLARPD